MRKRKTIGLIINNIDGNIQPILLKNVKKAAEKFDCNLIIFEGGILDSDNGVAKQHNSVYKLINRERIDGLIIPGCLIMDKVGHRGIIEFCKQFNGLPLISVGMEIPGATNLLLDNRAGMKSLIEHMVKDHGYKRIAFIKGPENNNEANERFEGYLEVLRENNIEIDDNLVFKGNWEAETGYLIMKKILSEDIKYDALVSANDDMAHGAIMCLKETESENQGLDLSSYYVVGGFDDTINATVLKPSLSTVRQSFEEIYFNAVDLLLKKIDNEKLDDVYTFPGIFVRRESCGCKIEKNSNSLPDGSLRVFTGYRLPENLQTFSKEDFLIKLTDALPGCFIRSCFISEYSEDSIIFDNNVELPNSSKLIYAYYNNERIQLNAEENHYNTMDIMPEKFLPDRQFTFLLQPLFFNDEQFGFVCFEGVNDIFYLYESLRGFLSTTLKGAKMLSEIRKMEEILLERERLASLAQIIGGISHSLNTPIMSISMGCSAIEELIKEYVDSVGNSQVTVGDHHEIAVEMQNWLDKVKSNNSYMSDIIKAARKQAIQLNANTTDEFTVQELMSEISLFISSDVKANKCKFNMYLNVAENVLVKGELSNLTRILYNLITNACESYTENKCTQPIIDFYVEKNKDTLMFIVKDYGKGIQENIKSRIFKQMVTTKGKNGSGLSLLLSFCAIKARFQGDIWFETSENHGTAFYISIPLNIK